MQFRTGLISEVGGWRIEDGGWRAEVRGQSSENREWIKNRG